MPFLSTVEGTNGFGKGPPAAAAPSGTIRVNIIGDSNIASIVTALNNAKTALGYPGTTITYTQSPIVAGYTGANLTTANFDVLLLYMNGGLSVNASLGANINAFIAAGGRAVYGVFLWNITISGLTYTNTPFVYRGAQSSEVATMTVTVTSPITTGITTTLSNGVSTFNQPSIVAQSDATVIATAPSGNPLVATQVNPRRVGINMFPGVLSSYTNASRLFVQAIMWAGGAL
jgi:hypothetical protein